jgi:hypothetical protein
MHFDGTITLGNIGTIVSIIAYAAFQYATMKARQRRSEERITLIENFITAHAKCHQSQEQIVVELREAVSFIKGWMSGAVRPEPARVAGL